MKNIIKKNQIILGTIALMLIAAGYMNYTVNNKNTLQTASLTDSEKYADLGDAQLVSSTNIIENKVQENNAQNDTNQEKIDSNNTTITNETKETSSNETQNTDIDKYFAQSKIDRENMYSQMLESYQKILNNNQIADTQKGIAENEIKNINDRKNAIMISENLIKNKGFKNAIIFLNDKSVNVVVKSDQLKSEQIAQIQNIIERELKADVANIHISNKS